MIEFTKEQKKLAAPIYNKALQDTINEYRIKLETIHEDIVFDLEE